MTFRQHIPTGLKRLARIMAYTALDTWDTIAGHREPMVPPRMTSLVVGSGDFKRTGEEFLSYFIRHAHLEPEHRVLEIGAGYGRMAVGLTSYIVPPGSYDGVEIIDKAVKWCEEEISKRFPHFLFHHADIRNPYSNPDGRGSATKYLLPFPDSTFNFIFLTSVFSHMPPPEIDAYLGEISRVLKPNGRCFITYYLLNDYALEQLRLRRASQPFYYSFNGFLATSRHTPENTIAVPEETILELYLRHRLTITEPILYGAWPGREHYLTYQDVIIAQRT